MPVVSMRRPDTPAVTLAYSIAAARRIASTALLVCPKCDPPMFYQAISGAVRYCKCGAELVEKPKEEPPKP
jgi:hypothetical protein